MQLGLFSPHNCKRAPLGTCDYVTWMVSVPHCTTWTRLLKLDASMAGKQEKLSRAKSDVIKILDRSVCGLREEINQRLDALDAATPPSHRLPHPAGSEVLPGSSGRSTLTPGIATTVVT